MASSVEAVTCEGASRVEDLASGHEGRDAMRQLQRAAAVGAADARRPARPHRVDEVLELEPQRLGLRDVQLAAVDGRPGGAQHDLIDLGFLSSR